ncbi:MAG: ATP-dependent RNA helicase HrpA, partial [Pseudomonadales bacterium]|nr:ATP-dependent RNA helicase HrpA [Pseudomonadales bacterium]
SRSQQAQPFDQLLRKLESKLEASKHRRSQRTEAVPDIHFPEQLPVSQNADKIIAAIRENPVVIIAGETGSGKSTQLPKMCLKAGRGIDGKIAHTQPRRLAARSLASRIAEELDRPLGETVGYKVRFQDQVGENTLIKLVTDGMLLAEIQSQRFLEEYDTIIIDEAHERSLNIDFLLGYLKQLLKKRHDLKVIITSATIDHERFSEHFDKAPIIEVSGRTFDVEVEYRPLEADEPDSDGQEESSQRDDETRLENKIIETLNEIIRCEREGGNPTRPSDILMFLPGERDIRQIANVLRRKGPKQLDILPLYSRLSNSEQQKVFQSHVGRRIVLATNVAETSITVPNIGYVIDIGTARVSRYSVRSKMQRLPIEPVSQASANQRKGRCGRIAEGVCYRLYDEADFLSRPEFTDPEILRTNLASVILQMESLGLGDIHRFPFIEKPDPRQVSDGYKLLEELNAIDANKHLTETGRLMARLPLDPRLARILIEAKKHGSLYEILIIVSALSVQDPWLRPHEKQQAADQAHCEFYDKQSDFATFVNLWAKVEEQREQLSNNQFRKWLLRNYISYLRIREWREVHYQLKVLVKELGWQENKEPSDYVSIHKALLAGLLSHVGMKEEKRLYAGTRNRKFVPFPGSTIHKHPCQWVMAAEIVETQKVYGRTLAQIESTWVEEKAKHLLKQRYFEPHWEKKRAAAMAFQQTTLMGLIINPKKAVNFSQIDPEQSREIFIYNALVAADYHTKANYQAHNKALIAKVEDIENRARRRDILVDDTALFEVFDKLVPAWVNNGKSFEKWRKQAEQENPKILYLTEADVTQARSDDVSEYSFPDEFAVQGGRLTIDYQFEPGRQQDGLTVEVPITLLNQIDDAKLEWLVPGLEREKCIALIKSLPKSARKYFVPAPNFSDGFLASNPDREQSLHRQFAEYLKRETRVDIRPESWRLDQLPSYLLAKIRVVDEQGKLIKESSDIASLKHELKGETKAAVASILSEQVDTEKYSQWDFGEVPEEYQYESKGKLLIAYPAVIDEQDGVRVQLFDQPYAAQKAMYYGLLRLFLLQLPQQIRYIKKHCMLPERDAIQYAPFGDKYELADGIVYAAFQRAFLEGQPLLRDQESFQGRLESNKSKLVDAANEFRALLADILKLHHQIEKTMVEQNLPTREASYNDIHHQLKELFPDHWIKSIRYQVLAEYPRYLNGIIVRIKRLQGNVERDQTHIPELESWWIDYQQRLTQNQEKGTDDPELDHFRWMLEEYRISLFAQEIKTKYPVSSKRLEKQWQKVQR